MAGYASGFQLPFSYDPVNPVSADIRLGKQTTVSGISTTIPFASVVEACSLVLSSVRFIGLTVLINDGSGGAVEYWWRVNTTDSGLIFKSIDTSTFVDKSSAQTIDGVKTFSSSPIVPTLSTGDNSTNAINSAFGVANYGRLANQNTWTQAQTISSSNGLTVTDGTNVNSLTSQGGNVRNNSIGTGYSATGIYGYSVSSGITTTLNYATPTVSALITIPNASGTLALTATTLAGYGITDTYTKTQSDSNYIKNLTTTSSAEAKSFNISGQNSIASGGDLSLYSTTDQTVNYGRLRLYSSTSGFVSSLFTGDQFYLSKEFGGTYSGTPRIIIGESLNNYINFNTPTAGTGASFLVNKLNASVATVSGSSGIQIINRAGYTTTGQNNLNGVVNQVLVDASNTADWTVFGTNHPIINGVTVNVNTITGGTGTIEKGAAYFGTVTSSGTKFNQVNLIDLTYGYGSVGTSQINYATGIRIAQFNAGVNGTGILFTNSDSDLPPTGYWTIYNTTGYNSYMGSAAVLINTTTDNTVDKLQINGSLISTGNKVVGGSSSQFQKGDGSLDSNTYALSSSLSSYIPYTGATSDVNLGTHIITASNLSGINTGDQTSVTGNAGTATILQTARTINGVSFNGSANITIPGSAITAIPNSSLSNSTISFTTGTAGTDINWSTSPVSLGGSIQLNIPDASSTNRGLITTGTQTISGVKTFNPITNTGTTQQGNIFNLTATATANNSTFTTLVVNAPNVTTTGFTGSIMQVLNVTGNSQFNGSLTSTGNVTANNSVVTPYITGVGTSLAFGPSGTYGKMNTTSANDGEFLWGTTGEIGGKVVIAGNIFGAFGNSNGLAIVTTQIPSLNNDSLFTLRIAGTNQTGLTAINSLPTPTYSGTATITTSGTVNLSGGSATIAGRVSYSVTNGATSFSSVSILRGGVGYIAGDIVTATAQGITATFTLGSGNIGLTGIKSGALLVNGDISFGNYTPSTAISTDKPLMLNSSGKITVGSSQNISQQYTASGTGSATTISITHSVSGVTSSSGVIVQAMNSESAGIAYVTISSTTVSITYATAPVSGTNNLLYTILIKP